MGTGCALPARRLTNAELATMVDTSDAWIVERTGISERRIAADDVSTSDLAASALTGACDDAGIGVDSLDGIILATSTADTSFPSTACWVQHKLGLSGAFAFDVSAGCSGFVYALELAGALLMAGRGRRIGVIGAEVMSKVVDWTDRTTCVLFGDGAGAVVIEASDTQAGILGTHWGADGTHAKSLYQPAGGTRMPASDATVRERLHTVHMQGKSVFRYAVEKMSHATKMALAEAELTHTDVDLLIPHQANARIMEATRQRTEVPRERMLSIVDRFGNMSAATIPVGLDEAAKTGRIGPGSIVVTTAFGTGYTWAAHVLRWG